MKLKNICQKLAKKFKLKLEVISDYAVFYDVSRNEYTSELTFSEKILRIVLGKTYLSGFKAEKYFGDFNVSFFASNFIFDMRSILTLFLFSLQKNYLFFFDKGFIDENKTVIVYFYFKNKHIEYSPFYLNFCYFIFYLTTLINFKKYEA